MYKNIPGPSKISSCAIRLTGINRIRAKHAGMSVLVATDYMEEAARFDWLVAMHAGAILATGSPLELLAQSKSTTLEEAFINYLEEVAFATTSLGIFIGTIARSMPQFGLLMMLILMPLQILSGGTTPRESMPVFVQFVMMAAPTTHFVKLGQAILFRGAGFEVVWPQFVFLALIGSVLFAASLVRFRKTIGMMT